MQISSNCAISLQNVKSAVYTWGPVVSLSQAGLSSHISLSGRAHPSQSVPMGSVLRVAADLCLSLRAAVPGSYVSDSRLE